jgi:hypothetical protein
MGVVMNPTQSEDWEQLAELPLDDADAKVMAAIATLYSSIDPVPAGMVDRLTFAMTWDALDAEIAELQRMPVGELAGARGSEATEVKTLTFTSDSVTTMVTISPAGPDRVRIDGWCAPAAAVTVELQQVNFSVSTEADSDGRFVFDSVPRGLSRLLIRPASEDRPTVVTPTVEF